MTYVDPGYLNTGCGSGAQKLKSVYDTIASAHFCFWHVTWRLECSVL